MGTQIPWGSKLDLKGFENHSLYLFGSATISLEHCRRYGKYSNETKVYAVS